MAGNVLRGALGHALRDVASEEEYKRIFEPVATGAGPSGLSNWPRPFVIRCAGLNGSIIQRGERFHFDLHLFDTREPILDHLSRGFAQWADLITVERSTITIGLDPKPAPISRIQVEFQTPTELKTAGAIADPDFPLLLARARDRVSTLRSLYGAGPLEIDFRGLAERAQSITTVRNDLRTLTVERRSSRTGQRHGIGGVIGFAEYQGDLAEFTPLLEAAHWTGVGRHCTWGNGQIQTTILNSEL
jgi:CRISPR-associated endoribonuclease Cas6